MWVKRFIGCNKSLRSLKSDSADEGAGFGALGLNFLTWFVTFGSVASRYRSVTTQGSRAGGGVQPMLIMFRVLPLTSSSHIERMTPLKDETRLPNLQLSSLAPRPWSPTFSMLRGPCT